MQRFLKFLFWTSISLLCIIVLFTILRQFIHIEFVDPSNESNYEYICTYGISIAILLILKRTINKSDSTPIIIFKILLTGFISLASFFIIATIYFATGMCVWTTNKTVFENKMNPSISIVERNLGCGATDSGQPVYKTFKVAKLIPQLIWVAEIDTNKIDKAEWNRINIYEPQK